MEGHPIETTDVDDVRVVAIGKASDALVVAVDRALDACGVPSVARGGVAVAHTPPTRPLPSWIERRIGGHPTPDASSLAAGARVLDALAGATTRTLALFLVSGGGSALVELPLDPDLGLDDVAKLTDALVRGGAPIRDINAVRKRISAIKGGRLALAAAPARCATFVVSDVAPGDLSSVASGPTLADETTMEEAVEALARTPYAASVRLVDTPPADALPPSTVALLADCVTAARAAEESIGGAVDRVVGLGCMDGPVEDVVCLHLDVLSDELSNGGTCAVVSSGEVTVDVRGEEPGGRNTHSVLAALVAARGRFDDHLVVLSAGTDGRDGTTDAAGAVSTLDALERSGLDARDHLERFASYAFFERLGGLIRTGTTGTNVRDVRVFVGRARRS